MSYTKDENSISDNYDPVWRFNSVGNIKKVQLMPYEHPLGNEKELKTHINDNLWLISDIHLSSNTERTNLIINRINRAVGKDGYILFLGDLVNKHTGTWAMVIDAMEKIKTPNKFLILGNHDTRLLHEYIDIGFKYVSDRFESSYKGWKVVFTHAPEPVNFNSINIHGHIHGSGEYWNMSPYRHYDVYVKSGIVNRDTNFSSVVDQTEKIPYIQQMKDLNIPAKGDKK